MVEGSRGCVMRMSLKSWGREGQEGGCERVWRVFVLWSWGLLLGYFEIVKVKLVVVRAKCSGTVLGEEIHCRLSVARLLAMSWDVRCLTDSLSLTSFSLCRSGSMRAGHLSLAGLSVRASREGRDRWWVVGSRGLTSPSRHCLRHSRVSSRPAL